jgi:hypothetical protein
VAEAAERLGITKEAVRKRVSRRTLRSDKDLDGTIRVYVPEPPTASGGAARDELVEALRGEIAHLRRESERKDAIIMSLSQANAEQARTIREIEAPQEASSTTRRRTSAVSPMAASPSRGATLTSGFSRTVATRLHSPGPSGTSPWVAGGPQEGAQRPWWRRWFGG